MGIHNYIGEFLGSEMDEVNDLYRLPSAVKRVKFRRPWYTEGMAKMREARNS
jgi:hypothetical protein